MGFRPPIRPIGAFRPLSGGPGDYSFLKADHVKNIMRDACIHAHPDPDHYMRKHIHLLHSHSNRITAAVALFNADVPIEQIAARLRWSVESVKHYLCECYTKIGALTTKAIEGAMIL